MHGRMAIPRTLNSCHSMVVDKMKVRANNVRIHNVTIASMPRVQNHVQTKTTNTIHVDRRHGGEGRRDGGTTTSVRDRRMLKPNQT